MDVWKEGRQGRGVKKWMQGRKEGRGCKEGRKEGMYGRDVRKEGM
jgi:hypothetical protein